MSKLILFSVILISAFAIYSFINPKVDFKTNSEGGIQFESNGFNQAIYRAKREKKLIFLDIYATWCGPCKRLKANTFSDAKVGNYYNSNFINVALNGEEGEGLELARKYAIKGYPTLLFLDGDGQVVESVSGYHNSNQFLELGSSVLKKWK